MHIDRKIINMVLLKHHNLIFIYSLALEYNARTGFCYSLKNYSLLWGNVHRFFSSVSVSGIADYKPAV